MLLTAAVIMWGAYINGFLCALFGYVYLRCRSPLLRRRENVASGPCLIDCTDTNPAYNNNGQYSAPIILFSFLIGINEGLTLGSVIDAGVSTIFVGLGEDPGCVTKFMPCPLRVVLTLFSVLAQRSPGLFEMIRQAYPRVIQGVPHY